MRNHLTIRDTVIAGLVLFHCSSAAWGGGKGVPTHEQKLDQSVHNLSEQVHSVVQASAEERLQARVARQVEQERIRRLSELDRKISKLNQNNNLLDSQRKPTEARRAIVSDLGALREYVAGTNYNRQTYIFLNVFQRTNGRKRLELEAVKQELTSATPRRAKSLQHRQKVLTAQINALQQQTNSYMIETPEQRQARNAQAEQAQLQLQEMTRLQKFMQSVRQTASRYLSCFRSKKKGPATPPTLPATLDDLSETISEVESTASDLSDDRNAAMDQVEGQLQGQLDQSGKALDAFLAEPSQLHSAVSQQTESKPSTWGRFKNWMSGSSKSRSSNSAR